MTNSTLVFLLHEQHQQILDGDLTALQRPYLTIISVVAPILLTIGIITSSLGISIIIRGLSLDTYGIRTNGIVRDVKVLGRGRGMVIKATYSFVANNGQIYTQEIDTERALTVGDPVQVIYNGSNPTESRLNVYNPEERNTMGGHFAFGLPCLFVGILGLATKKQRLNKWHRLTTQGHLIEGNITGLKQYVSRNRSGVETMINIRYEFASPSNKLLKGRMKVPYTPAYNQLAIGTSVAVLYVNNRLFELL